MEALSRLVIASADLLEAEGRALKKQTAHLLFALGLGAVALVMIVIGFCFLLYGGFKFLSAYLNDFGAALVFGIVALVIATATLVYARQTLRRS